MTWIDDAERESQAIQERKRLILEQEEKVYELLWQDIKTQINDAARLPRFRELAGNGGQSLSRVVRLPMYPGSRDLAVSLSKRDHTIQASRSYSGGGSEPMLTLQIDVCEDGFVCMKLDGEQISPRDAAIKVLHPYLFPELHDEPAKRRARLV